MSNDLGCGDASLLDITFEMQVKSTASPILARMLYVATAMVYFRGIFVIRAAVSHRRSSGVSHATIQPVPNSVVRFGRARRNMRVRFVRGSRKPIKSGCGTHEPSMSER